MKGGDNAREGKREKEQEGDTNCEIKEGSRREGASAQKYDEEKKEWKKERATRKKQKKQLS